MIIISNYSGQPQTLAVCGVQKKLRYRHGANWNAKLRPVRNCSAQGAEQLLLFKQAILPVILFHCSMNIIIIKNILSHITEHRLTRNELPGLT